MKTRLLKLFDVIIFGAKTEDNRSVSTRRRALRRSLFIVMLLLTIIPLVVALSLSFYQYRKLLNEETTINTKWSAETARQTIEAFVGKLQAAILVISDAYRIEELSDQDTLAEVFARLKREHPGIVDLSLIGSDGLQRAYAGPFDLTGKNYSDQEWFNKAIRQEMYVSDVFLGYRKVPHFVVAVSKRSAGKVWLLRASVNSKTLDQFLSRVNSDMIDDIVLTNAGGSVQTSLTHKLQMFEKIEVPAGVTKNSLVSLFHERHDGRSVIRAYGIIKDTPWILVLDQQNYAVRQQWINFTSQLTLTVVICVLLTGLMIARVAGFLARRIVEAEQTMESALSQTEHTNRLAAIGRLAGGVAHEINNPLAIINEKSGLLLDILEVSEDFPRKESFIKHMVSLQNAVIRARDITHRLLGFARRTEEKLEPVSVNHVIKEVLSFIEKEALYRNVKIELEFDDDLPVILSDIGQLQQVFLNIINNALDAVPEFGQITIHGRRGVGTILIDISDNGAGMSPDVARQIFEPFFTTKTGKEKHGTGLGLFITYGIVKKLGGEISVESELGKGTMFRLSFPATAQKNGG